MALYVDGCGYCYRMKAEGRDFFPDHNPSQLCESGKRPHCTCDRCF